jgi:hypothetical protein
MIMDKLKLNANNLDYTKIERPVEPAFGNEDPEGWCEVLAWEEARADKLEQENAELRFALERAIRIKDLWLPISVPNEHEGEAEALHRMYNSFESLLNK